jgi:hypothetical protein
MEKYTLLRNYIHNELGITKADIKMWVEDSARQTTERLIKDYLSQNNQQEIIRNTVKGVIGAAYSGKWHNFEESVKSEVTKAIAAEIKNRFSIMAKG